MLTLRLQVSVTIKQPSQADYSLELDLAHAVDANNVEKKIYGTKVQFLFSNLSSNFNPNPKAYYKCCCVYV